MLKENLKRVEQHILDACKASGRTREEVTLIAVSKTKPVGDLKEIYEAGVRDFGENKVQELCGKYEVLPKDIRWHMIGHLQRNKVKYIVDKVTLIHSVDSLRLAQQIQTEAEKADVHVNILIEVNVAGEESKFGITCEQTEELVREIAQFNRVHIQGFMTIAPFVENSDENREIFQKLYQLYIDIKRKNIDNVNMCVLSMGMTGDYTAAVEEGATMVRVGTGIFGERNYNR